MPWTMNDYPQSWKNMDELERKKAIDIGNAMLKDGYKEGDAIPIATEQAGRESNLRFLVFFSHFIVKRTCRRRNVTLYSKFKEGDRNDIYDWRACESVWRYSENGSVLREKELASSYF